MGTCAGVGMSHHRNPTVAGQEATEKALKQAGIHHPDFVLLFAAVGYNQQVVVDTVRQETGNAPLFGCSGAGIIAIDEADESNFSVGVMVIQSDELHFSHGVATGLKQDPDRVGREVGKEIEAQQQPDTLAMILLADGITFNFDRFITALETIFHPTQFLPIFGGAAGGNLAMQHTYQYCNDQVITDGVVWALLSGKGKVAWALNHGCIPIGCERKVTRCEANVIYEIDHQPVLEVLKEYLLAEEIDGNWQKVVNSLCLGFKAPGHLQNYDEYLIRFMLTKDEATGAITLPSEVTVGTSIWMTRRDYEKIAKGVTTIAQEIKDQIGNCIPKFVLQFDCTGRGKSAFRDQQKLQLLQTLQQSVGTEIPWLGFYTYGEIGPVSGHNCFHNYTAVLMTVY
ncbi:MAG: FIST C-terminal domain-containing protein [Scytolyngbya sp. HA4215-MV1]|jgi:hypothetical protein|nr:FIST C-terminal domain-containing protein [Scytolyngbya sp. HA4215-MV1]